MSTDLHQSGIYSASSEQSLLKVDVLEAGKWCGNFCTRMQKVVVKTKTLSLFEIRNVRHTPTGNTLYVYLVVGFFFFLLAVGNR